MNRHRCACRSASIWARVLCNPDVAHTQCAPAAASRDKCSSMQAVREGETINIDDY